MKLKLILFILIGSLVILASCTNTTKKESKKKQPNIVIIFLDDSGYSDFAPFGQTKIETPNVQKLADEGIMFKNFYVPQAICSASRSALITGCYPERTHVFGAHGPNEKGLDPKFPTMGEIFGAAGYNTAIFGKWHCGDLPETRPHNRGYQESCGLMYSNDMWKHHPMNPEYWGRFPIQFWENGEVKIPDVDSADQKMLTRWYTEHAVDFINRQIDEPFLLYVPHSMPHVPLFVSDEFEGKSGAGLYTDVMLEIDWSVGEINKALKNNGLEDNTIVIFSSDNGPWAVFGNHAGTTPFREAKATSFDGGTRSACIIKYPTKIEGGQESTKALMTIDLLPTLCDLTGVPLPGTEIDGKNVWNIITNKKDASNPHDYYSFTSGKNMEAVMTADGKWKLHFAHDYRALTDTLGKNGMPGKTTTKHIELSLFDMENDPFETTNVIVQYPEIAGKLMEYAKSHKAKFFNEQ
ncbi:MAG: sulfatase [Bacteroidota bacterium]